MLVKKLVHRVRILAKTLNIVVVSGILIVRCWGISRWHGFVEVGEAILRSIYGEGREVIWSDRKREEQEEEKEQNRGEGREDRTQENDKGE
jgi:hypothetical protein